MKTRLPHCHIATLPLFVKFFRKNFVGRNESRIFADENHITMNFIFRIASFFYKLFKKIFPEPKWKVEKGRELAAQYGVQDIFDAAIKAGYTTEEALNECDVDSDVLYE